MRTRAVSLFSLTLNYVHYIGLVAVIWIYAEARRTIHESDETLNATTLQEETLRSLLWNNLLVQRSTAFSLESRVVGDPSYLERGQTIASAISDDGADLDAELQRHLGEFQKQQKDLYDHSSHGKLEPRPYDALFQSANRVGEELNRVEAKEWFALHDRNEKLISDVKDGHQNLMKMFALFLGYLGFLGWIIDRKRRAEKALRDSEAKMVNVAKMSALGEMAGGIAHEINTPLGTIGVVADQLRELFTDEEIDRPLVTEMTGTISETVIRISKIIQGLQTFSRDGSRDPFKPARVGLIVENTMSLCQEKIKNSQVRIEYTPCPDLLEVDCRGVQITQVLLNLVCNACDAIQSLGDKWMKIDVVDQGPKVVIRIIDCGAGIPAATREKLFQPFFTTKDIGKGTGLGLSISKGIIESHGGSLSIDTQCKNTCFVVDLPKKHGAVIREIPPGRAVA